MKKIGQLLNLAIFILFAFFDTSIVIITAIFAFLKIIEPGKIFPMGNLANRLFRGISNCTSLYPIMKGSRHLLEKFKVSNDKNKESENHLIEIEKEISIRNLQVNFGNKSIAYKDFDFEIGKKYMIYGESGSGKSTLIKLILGLNDNYKGDILFDGVERKNYSKVSIYDQIAYIPQSPHLFNDKIKFNLTLNKNYSDTEIYEVLRKVKLEDKINSFKGKLDFSLNEDTNPFSGGERQRLIIARALLQNKKILFIDEATSALDKRNTSDIIEMLNSDKTLTILSINHNVDIKENNFDDIYFL